MRSQLHNNSDTKLEMLETKQANSFHHLMPFSAGISVDTQVQRQTLKDILLSSLVVTDCTTTSVEVSAYEFAGRQMEIGSIAVNGLSVVLSAPLGSEVENITIEPKYSTGLSVAEIVVNHTAYEICVPTTSSLEEESDYPVTSRAVLSAISSFSASADISAALSALSVQISSALCSMVSSLSSQISGTYVKRDDFSGDFDVADDGTISLYKALAINSFSMSPSTVERGTKVSKETVNWTLSKVPFTQTLNGATLDNAVRSYVQDFDPPIDTSPSTAALPSYSYAATDKRGATASKSLTLNVLLRHYWGAATADNIIRDQGGYQDINPAFLDLMSSELVKNLKSQFTVNAGAGEHIFYILPARAKMPRFFVGGFEGGFEKYGTYDCENKLGFTTRYDIYMSSKTGLGITIVDVKDNEN